MRVEFSTCHTEEGGVGAGLPQVVCGVPSGALSGAETGGGAIPSLADRRCGLDHSSIIENLSFPR